MSASDSCRLVTEFLSSFVRVCVLRMCPFLTSRQLLLPCSVGSMTSSRTTTPVTARKRPSHRRRGARRSTTVEDCWGASFMLLCRLSTSLKFERRRKLKLNSTTLSFTVNALSTFLTESWKMCSFCGWSSVNKVGRGCLARHTCMHTDTYPTHSYTPLYAQTHNTE